MTILFASLCAQRCCKSPQPDLELLMRDHASEWCMAGKPWRWHHISMCKRLPEMDQRKETEWRNMMEYDGILSQAVWTCFFALVLVCFFFGGYFLGESGFATVKNTLKNIRFKASWWVEPKQCWHPAKHSQGERSFSPGCFPRRLGKQCYVPPFPPHQATELSLSLLQPAFAEPLLGAEPIYQSEDCYAGHNSQSCCLSQAIQFPVRCGGLLLIRSLVPTCLCLSW